MRPTVALALLLTACAPELPRPPDCNRTPPVRNLFCEGSALGAYVTYLRVDYAKCTEVSATVEVEGEALLEATVYNTGRVILGEWIAEEAVNPQRLLVTRGEMSEAVRNCKEERP